MRAVRLRQTTTRSGIMACDAVELFAALHATPHLQFLPLRAHKNPPRDFRGGFNMLCNLWL